MKKRTYISALLIAAIGSMAFVGCVKERPYDGLRLIAEGFGTGDKLYVDGTASYWIDGESVRINGYDKDVVVDGENAYIANVPEAEVYRAIYPASLNSSATLDGDNVTVTIPASYEWDTTADGKQIISVPMAAKGTSDATLFLRHITAAIDVEIVNHYGFAVIVDNITVSSDEGVNKYQLSGSKEITLGTDDITATPSTTDNDDDRQVQLNFTKKLKIYQGETKTVQVPVLPVGSGNKFTINVTVHKDGNTDVNKTYTKTQNTGGAMGRAKLATAKDTVGFTFSVSGSKKVIISQGNLQWKGTGTHAVKGGGTAAGTWRFAPEQFNCIGDAAGNNVFDETRPTQDAWIDLFGWGTSGWENREANGGKDTIIYYRPYDYIGTVSSSSGYYYGPRHKEENSYSYTYSLTGDYEKSDWGVYNAISNGGNVAGRWRTMTGGDGGEWDYLLKTRTASTVNNISNARFYKAKINNICGVIIFPDKYQHPANSGNPTNINQDGYYSWGDVPTLELSNWYKMEAEGAVFIPCVGYRSYSNNAPYFYAYNSGYYWTSTYYSTSSAYYVQLSTNVRLNQNNGKRLGMSVRLVRDVD